jgi:hypothetical protein
MKKISIGFSKAKSIWKIGSTAIQLAEKREYSHVYISYFSEEKQCSMVAQASHGYVNEISLQSFEQSNIIIKQYELAITDAQFNQALSFIGSKMGSLYSKMQILLIAIKKLIKFEIKQYNQDKYFICSEFAAIVCRILGVKVPANLDYVTPSDLDTILQQNGLKSK